MSLTEEDRRVVSEWKRVQGPKGAIRRINGIASSTRHGIVFDMIDEGYSDREVAQACQWIESWRARATREVGRIGATEKGKAFDRKRLAEGRVPPRVLGHVWLVQ